MAYWNDLINTQLEVPLNYNIIPHGTIAKVKIRIKPGGYNDQDQGWIDGYATKSPITSSIYLDAEFFILEGKYARRKIWSLIGLYSPKGPEWANMGKSFIRSMINSAKGLSPKDICETTMKARNITSFAAVDGLIFAAKIDVTTDQNGNQKNEIRTVITADHKDYESIMGRVNTVSNNIHNQNQQQSINNSNRPTWA
jgi:hypothetical protein